MIEVRRGRRADLPFIRELLVATLTESIPEGREINNETVHHLAEESIDLAGMLERFRDFGFLVAVEGDKKAGFLILEFNQKEETTGENQTLIYHLAVAPNFLGHRVDRLLVNEAAKWTHSRGSQYMVGRITASNERALFAALRQGFEVERYQIVMACGPEGKKPMPGRPESERGHDLRRLVQRRKKREARKSRE